MNKLLDRFPLAFALVVVGIASVTLVTARKDPPTMKTMKAEPEILAIHYKPPSLEVTTLAELDDDDILDDAPWWAQVLLSDPEDPDAKAAGQIEEIWEDPIEPVKKTFLSFLQTEEGFHNIRSIGKSQRRRLYNVKRLKEKFPGVMILDFTTTSLSFRPKVSTSRRYRLVYTAKARLIHPETSRAVWTANCGYVGTAHRLEAFVQKDAKLLKKALAKATQHCAEEFYVFFFDGTSPG